MTTRLLCPSGILYFLSALGLAALAAAEDRPPITHICDDSMRLFTKGISVPVQGEDAKGNPSNLLTVGTDAKSLDRIFLTTKGAEALEPLVDAAKTPVPSRPNTTFQGFTGLHATPELVSFMGFPAATTGSGSLTGSTHAAAGSAAPNSWRGVFAAAVPSTAGTAPKICTIVDTGARVPCITIGEGRSDGPAPLPSCARGSFASFGDGYTASSGGGVFFSGVNATRGPSYEGIFRATMPPMGPAAVRGSSDAHCTADLEVVVDSTGTNTGSSRIYGIGEPSVSGDGTVVAFFAQDGLSPDHHPRDSSTSTDHQEVATWSPPPAPPPPPLPPHRRTGHPPPRTGQTGRQGQPTGQQAGRPPRGGRGMLGGARPAIFAIDQIPTTTTKSTPASKAGTASLALKRLVDHSTQLPLPGGGVSAFETFVAFSDPLVDRRTNDSVVFMGQGSLDTLGLYHANLTSGRTCTVVDTNTEQVFLGFDPASFTVDGGLVAFQGTGLTEDSTGIYVTRLPPCDGKNHRPFAPNPYRKVAMLGDKAPDKASPGSEAGTASSSAYQFVYVLARAESLSNRTLALYGSVVDAQGSGPAYDAVYRADLTKMHI